MKNKITKGFTLIELLVVVSIIGLLASIVLSSLDGSRKKGRDARRISDVKQIQLALELYYDANNSFPIDIQTTAGSCSQTSPKSCATLYLTEPGYISVVPKDPQNSRDYNYTSYSLLSNLSSPYVSYHLGTSLETQGHPAFQTDADLTAQAGAAPKNYYPVNVSVDFDGTDFQANGTTPRKCNNNDYGVQCYDVTP